MSTGMSWEIRVKDGKLRAGPIPLIPLAADRFGIGNYPIELVFTPAREGKPRTLTWIDVDVEVFEAAPELTLSRAQREEYAGTYRSDELNAEYMVSLRNGELAVR